MKRLIEEPDDDGFSAVAVAVVVGVVVAVGVVMTHVASMIADAAKGEK